MADKSVLLTKDGLKKLQERLDDLKSVKRLEVAERLKAAIALGDLSENSEYDDAKNEQAWLEGEIKDLEEKIRNAKLIEDNADSDVVSMGSKVVLKDLEFDETEVYQLVGSTEADPDEGKISNESPVGIAINGKSVGEVVEVQVGENIIKYEIVEIKR
ncbi:MAG: transcription elongation factor GreA [Anaerovibrio sp.]|uniref:transcription elongation factor GreA n=1 Tax=Anaerovibrio sp. TaxID=1872532 RepID=UPI0025B84D68|nr:transcription elongation factor GreA [Anaerovibrio sp.]MBE6099784.1 transcription elongation factor GreA [Anaerovibrio sp.]